MRDHWHIPLVSVLVLSVEYMSGWVRGESVVQGILHGMFVVWYCVLSVLRVLRMLRVLRALCCALRLVRACGVLRRNGGWMWVQIIEWM